MPPSQTPTGPSQTPRALERLVDLVTEVDGVEPLSDAALLADTAEMRHITAGTQTGLLGAAVVDTRLGIGELAVAPEARSSGLGEQLWRATLTLGARAWWAHGDLPAARRLAEIHGLVPQRRLWRYERTLLDSLPPAVFPDGWSVRPFRPEDVQQMLAVNRAAFADLPDQGGWTVADIVARQTAAWFRDDDLLVLVEGERLRGFHWTKVRGAGVGEVYVVALSPEVRGRGLGCALTLAGLEHLQARDCDSAMLFVDEDNVAAVRTYRNLGFEPVRLDVLYGMGPDPGRNAEPSLER